MKPGNGAVLDHVNTVRTGKSIYSSIHLEGPACKIFLDLAAVPVQDIRREDNPGLEVLVAWRTAGSCVEVGGTWRTREGLRSRVEP